VTTYEKLLSEIEGHRDSANLASSEARIRAEVFGYIASMLRNAMRQEDDAKEAK